MDGLAKRFDGSLASRYLEPHHIISEVETLAILLSYASGNAHSSTKETKEKAEELLSEFGSLGSILHATSSVLQNSGLSMEDIALLKTILAAQLHVLEANIKKGTAITSWNQLTDYLTASIAYNDTEHFKALFLDGKNVLIKDEKMGIGTVDHVPVYPREVVKRALELNASAVILVHNHPSGSPKPSQQDIDMTNQVVKACRAVNITVHDHIIVGHNQNFTSFRDQCLIR